MTTSSREALATLPTQGQLDTSRPVLALAEARAEAENPDARRKEPPVTPGLFRARMTVGPGPPPPAATLEERG